jgi:hypothetical protein
MIFNMSIFLNLSVREERCWALFYMPLYTFIHILLNVLVQIANKMRLRKEKIYMYIWIWIIHFRSRRLLGPSWTQKVRLRDTAHRNRRRKIKLEFFVLQIDSPSFPIDTLSSVTATRPCSVPLLKGKPLSSLPLKFPELKPRTETRSETSAPRNPAPPSSTLPYKRYSKIETLQFNFTVGLINQAPRHEFLWGSRDIAPTVLTSALDVRKWLASPTCHFTQGVRASHPLSTHIA